MTGDPEQIRRWHQHYVDKHGPDSGLLLVREIWEGGERFELRLADLTALLTDQEEK